MTEKRFYLTKQGFENFKKEYQQLLYIRGFKTKEESPQFWHSEEINSEYLSFWEDLNLLEIRIAELENILKNIEIITFPPKNKQNIINLGAQVKVKIDGQTDEFTIVGPLEASPSLGRISNESPVGKALLGHRVGDEVLVQSEAETLYKIKKIKYKNI